MFRSIINVKAAKLSSFTRSLSMPSLVTGSGRRVLLPEYPLKTKKGRKVRMEVAEHRDYDLVDRMTFDHFSKLEKSSQGVGTKPENLHNQVVKGIISNCLRYPFSTLAFDGDELIGYYLINVDCFKQDEEYPPLGLDDFGELEKQVCSGSGITDQKVRYVATVLYYATYIAPHFLPKKDKQYVAHGEMICVNQNYKGNGLVGAMVQQSCKAIREHDYVDYTIGNPTTIATHGGVAAVGMEKVWDIKYKDIKFNGVNVYKDVNEQAFVSLNVGRVEDVIKSNYTDKYINASA